MTPLNAAPRDPAPSAWWHHPMMWLVLGGPAVVVVAAIATAVIAVRGADVVLHLDGVPARAALPAMQARNHAATLAAPAPAKP